MFTKENLMKKVIPVVALLIIAILSITVVTKYATSTEVHAGTIKELDNKKIIAMELTAGVALTSSAIAAVPSDATTPIANQISELTGPLFLVVCAIYLEKFLLTTVGYISFTVLIPLSCILLMAYIFLKKEKLKNLAIKLSVFALAIFLIVPASVKVSELIEKTFEASIEQTYENAIAEKEENEDKNGLQQIWNDIKEGTAELVEKAKNTMNAFVDATAVLLITVCVIPIAVIFFIAWIVKLLFGINIDVSNAKNLLPKRNKKKEEE